MVLVRSGVSKPWVIEDALWDRIEPLLPRWPDRSPGPRPVPDRQCLQGVLFVLYTGIGWEDLPQELGFGSGMNLLAAAETVVRGGRVRAAAPAAAERVECRRAHRLVEGGDGR
jgi:transposase